MPAHDHRRQEAGHALGQYKTGSYRSISFWGTIAQAFGYTSTAAPFAAPIPVSGPSPRSRPSPQARFSRRFPSSFRRAGGRRTEGRRRAALRSRGPGRRLLRPPRRSVPPPADGGDCRAEGPFLAAGASHTCAIFGAGAVRCWGDNTLRSARPRRPSTIRWRTTASTSAADRRATAVYAGLYHTCVILDGGAVKCWGDNSFGQLGLGDMVNRGDGTCARWATALPVVDLGTGERAVALALGSTASCALLDDGAGQVLGRPVPGRDRPRRHDAARRSPGHDGRQPAGRRPRQPRRRPVQGQGDRRASSTIRSARSSTTRAPTTAGSSAGAATTTASSAWARTTAAAAREPETFGDGLEWVDLGTTAAGAKRKAVALARRISIDLRARRRRRGQLLGHQTVRRARQRDDGRPAVVRRRTRSGNAERRRAPGCPRSRRAAIEGARRARLRDARRREP